MTGLTEDAAVQVAGLRMISGGTEVLPGVGFDCDIYRREDL